MFLSHLGLLCKKSCKVTIRRWLKLLAELIFPSILCALLFFFIWRGETEGKERSRTTTRYDGPELFAYEHRVGARLRGTDTLKFRIDNSTNGIEREEISEAVGTLCGTFACFAQEMEGGGKGQYVNILAYDGHSLNAYFTSSDFFVEPSFKMASEEFERKGKMLPYPSQQFHRFFGTVLQENARTANFTGNVYIRYMKEVDYEQSGDNVLFNSADTVTRHIVHAIVLLMPAVCAMQMSTEIGDERKSDIKKYLLTMGISRATYFLHHIITALAKNIYFCVIAAFIIFGSNLTFTLLFSLTFILYLISILSLAVLITTLLVNPKLISDAMFTVFATLAVIAVKDHVSRTHILHSLFLSLLPGHALYNALDALRECSLKGGNISLFADFQYALPFGAIVITQIISSILILCFSLFVDDIVSSSFNPMKLLSRFMKKETEDERGSLYIHEHERDPERYYKGVVIDIKDVHKTFATGGKALKGTNLKIYEGQNTILLGQNGAGKSTLFDLITGASLPTSGTITINWPKVSGNEKQLERIGLCPQYSPVFEKLTVMEHLHFFATIGGESEWENKAIEFIELLSLGEYKHEFAGNLSGGNRRKLCIAMALIGKSNVILMDEPSAGVDTESRATIKKFLNEKRGEKTLLITTHYTDEAEDLGDRIAIMVNGKIACSGTTAFLAKEFGSGYDLKCVVNDKKLLDATSERTLRLAMDYVHANLKYSHGEEFDLLIDNKDNNRILAFSRELDNSRERIGLNNVGWSTTPLESVFLAVAERTGSIMESVKMVNGVKRFLRMNSHRASNERRLWNSLLALLYKRGCFEWRNKFYQLYYGALILLTVTVFSGSINFMGPSEPLDLLQLRECGRVAFQNASDLSERFRALAAERGECIVVEDVDDVFEWHRRDFFARPPIIGAILKSGEDYTIAVANNRRIYEPYVATMLYKCLTDAPQDIRLSYQRKPTIPVDPLYVGYAYLVVLYLFQAMAIARFVRAYVIEEETGYAHLQLLAGCPKWLYWTGHFIMDAFVFALFYTYLYIVCRHANFAHEKLIELLFPNALCFLITLIKVALLYRLFKSKNNATLMCTLFVIFSIFFFLPVYFNLQKVVGPTFSIETSFPLFADPYVAVLAKHAGFADNAPNLYIILFSQLILFVSMFCVCESRDFKRARKRTCKRRDSGSGRTVQRRGDIELQPLSDQNKAEEEIGVEARPRHPRNVILEATNLKKRYGKKEYAVKGLTMAVEQNECFGLLGHNGAGKTTTFKMLTGQVFADSGEGAVSGVDCDQPAEIGYCPQEDALINQLTGNEHLVVLAALHGYASPFKVAEALIDCVGMQKHCDKVFKRLSGGQRRKFSVSASILGMNRLIVLDEPTTGIDPIVRNDIWSLLKSIRDFTNTAIVLTSHSMSEVEALCSRVAVMKSGLIVTHGSPQTLISKHGEFYKVEFICASTDPELKEDQIRTIAGELMPDAVWQKRILSRHLFKLPRDPIENVPLFSDVFHLAKLISEECGDNEHECTFTINQSNLEDTFLALKDEEESNK